jgi:hypothetical protein
MFNPRKPLIYDYLDIAPAGLTLFNGVGAEKLSLKPGLESSPCPTLLKRTHDFLRDLVSLLQWQWAKTLETSMIIEHQAGQC